LNLPSSLFLLLFQPWIDQTSVRLLLMSYTTLNLWLLPFPFQVQQFDRTAQRPRNASASNCSTTSGSASFAFTFSSDYSIFGLIRFAFSSPNWGQAGAQTGRFYLVAQLLAGSDLFSFDSMCSLVLQSASELWCRIWFELHRFLYVHVMSHRLRYSRWWSRPV
jgi:hypothetical protein